MASPAFATLAALPRAGSAAPVTASSAAPAQPLNARISSKPARFAAAASSSEFVGARVRGARAKRVVAPSFGVRAVAAADTKFKSGRTEITQVGKERPADHPCNEDPLKRKAELLYLSMQHNIVSAFEEIDGSGDFRVDAWDRKTGGGGVTMVKQGGNVFEKSGVAVSCVHGSFGPEAFVQAAQSVRMPGTGAPVERPSGEVPFFACGVSSVNHPWNPHAPTMHFNYRYFEIGGKDGVPKIWWYGGGADLTPSYLYEEDAIHFHQVHKDACDKHDKALYPKYKKWCDEYFLIKHRGETRGVGGIFFDDWNDRDQEAIMAFQKDCADALIPAYIPLVEKRKDQPFTEAEKEWQQIRRGRYVEYNLVYDRGTQFGLRTGGRTESILMSMPLTARWEYDHEPAAGSREAELLKVTRTPRDWLNIGA
eukprot:tig00001409_g8632.t1